MKNPSLDTTDLTWLAGLARALLREPHAADDLVQDTALAALEGPIPREVPRRAWLAGVARRLAARRFRSEARRSRREESAARPEGLPAASDLVARAEVAEKVTAAARRLPEPYRRTILLRFLEGRSPEEIARGEQKPGDTVRWRIRRGLELLRAELVRSDGRDWSSWSVLLVPLARSSPGVALASVGSSSALVIAPWIAMKVLYVTLAAVGIGLLFLWTGSLPVRQSLSSPEVPEPTAVRGGPEPRVAPLAVEGVDPEAERRAASLPGVESAAVAEPSSDLFGEVVDDLGEPVADAAVYLVPVAEGEALQDEFLRTDSDRNGTFRFLSSEVEDESLPDSVRYDLRIAANGFLRAQVRGAWDQRSDRGLRVELQRGLTLRGRVLDELGQPVPDLDLLAHSADAGLAHVSPTQSLLRARRAERADVDLGYEACRSRTDRRGEVLFTGLPADKLRVRSLDPAWGITDPGRVEADGSYVTWTARSLPGVRVVVIDTVTGRPVERASAVFRVEVTFADGEVREFGQWVGRGQGEVSFTLGSSALPGLEERTLQRARFYGTARGGEGPEAQWTAEPIPGTGLALARVEVEPRNAPPPPNDPNAAEPELVELELDVRYRDGAPFDGELDVRWSSRSGNRPLLDGASRAKAVTVGRYRLEVPAGEVTLEVADRWASGSMESWRETLDCYPGRPALGLVTLPRGASVVVERPEGWSGEWFVQTSRRTPGEEAWQGGWGYSTDETSLTLEVMRPGEWRFELRRDSALEPDPLVRTALLVEGRSVRAGD